MRHMVASSLPYLTEDLPPIPAAIKERDEDFFVEEIPAYLPSGEGDHVYFGIEKRGLTTMRAVREIAGALGVRPDQIGCAGLKDARGVTRQTMSLEHSDPDRIAALALPRIKVLWVSRHRNKLRTGHLRGNRFAIKLREVDPARLGDVREALASLARRGVPNYFGPQRFGARGDTWEIGRALLRHDFAEAVALVGGRPRAEDRGDVLRARELYEEGRLDEAADAWPRGFGDNARLVRFLARRPGEHEKAIFGLDRKLLGLYASAYQSHLFNRVVAARVQALDRVELGDLAWKHDKGVVFRVDAPEAENPRAERGEISPSGPMYGERMSWPTERPGAFEAELLAGEGMTVDSFPRSGPLKCAGGRRPLRFLPKEVSAEAGADEHGAFIEVRFALDSGCYATVLLREVCKDGLVGDV
jgi:tRNA pseudouridine13 synthase